MSERKESEEQAVHVTPVSNEETRPQKKHRGKKFLTALLIVALGAGSGYAGAWLYDRSNGTSDEETVIFQSVNNSASNVSTDGTSLSDVIAAVQDSVVQITTESVQTNGFFGNYVTSGAGSGVIITSNGYIATNYHVIEDATKITVTLTDESSYEAEVVGKDADNDLAVLKIDATGLQPAVLGDSDSLSVGQTVIVIGNPLGTLGGSVTSGIISALSRDVTVEGNEMTLLQIDAAVNPGNSGGGLFDTSGNLIGIVNAKYEDTSVEGIGFAIPINTAKNILEQLISQGYVSGKVKLGVTIVEVSEEQLRYYRVDQAGVYISQVESGSDAETAGLRSGDLILSIDGTEITTASQVTEIVQSHSVGDTMTMVIQRDGNEQTVTVTLTEQGAREL